MTSPKIQSFELFYMQTGRMYLLITLGIVLALMLVLTVLILFQSERLFWLAQFLGLAIVFGLGAWASAPVVVLVSLNGIKILSRRKLNPYRLPVSFIPWAEIEAIRESFADCGGQFTVECGAGSFRLSGNETAAKGFLAAVTQCKRLIKAAPSAAASN